MRYNRSIFPVLLLLIIAIAGCASTRGVSVGSDTANYAIDVTNSTGSAVDVYWSAGGDPKMLGNVAPGRKEHFIVAGAKTTSISVTATNAAGRSLGPYAVVLEAGVSKAVTIR